MAHDLEAPCPEDAPAWDALYRARGDEVVESRPVLTGDVFAETNVSVGAEVQVKTVIVLQHPCALRSNGVDLVGRLLVAEVRPHKPLPPADWRGYARMMPLPDLYPDVASRRRDQAVFFEKVHVIDPDGLGRRDACLSPLGVNLLLQRWVHHNSRVVVPTFDFDDVTHGPYEECDLTEDWAEARESQAVDRRRAWEECHEWLRVSDQEGGPTRQSLLGDAQRRSSVRLAARKHWKSL
ncbi:hypothetical protein FHX52_4419 [Humibacillus xanthopallidus]|uniref:Uncharacterized protein n=1 Tax=Humibacillus xanthopallidus TaxID=412689 RepID=A0A543PM96_9MICO|nr:hypothetical protein FHX52_4419 [Humibacillus xanthopallidus]